MKQDMIETVWVLGVCYNLVVKTVEMDTTVFRSVTRIAYRMSEVAHLCTVSDGTRNLWRINAHKLTHSQVPTDSDSLFIFPPPPPLHLYPSLSPDRYTTSDVSPSSSRFIRDTCLCLWWRQKRRNVRPCNVYRFWQAQNFYWSIFRPLWVIFFSLSHPSLPPPPPPPSLSLSLVLRIPRSLMPCSVSISFFYQWL